MRFVYILLGAFLGFIGIGIGLFIHLLLLCNLKSFGAPYLAPYSSDLYKEIKGLFMAPAWKRETRANFLNTKREKKQKPISMKWQYPKSDQ